jgi:hypothetical protein
MAVNWTHDELFAALRLYFETPFGRLHRSNPEIIALAGRLGRTASAVAMKLSNFASLDPEIVKSGRKGLSGASAADRAAWAAFTGDWDAAISRTATETVPEDRATEAEEVHKRRIGQEFFRRAVLANFNDRCCASGVAEPRLLVASHIVPWAEDSTNRLNPANGLCLAATLDRAFDAHLITLDEDLRWCVSRPLLGNRDFATAAIFRPLQGQPINAPSSIGISTALVARHRERAKQCHAFG